MWGMGSCFGNWRLVMDEKAKKRAELKAELAELEALNAEATEPFEAVAERARAAAEAARARHRKPVGE